LVVHSSLAAFPRSRPWFLTFAGKPGQYTPPNEAPGLKQGALAFDQLDPFPQLFPAIPARVIAEPVFRDEAWGNGAGPGSGHFFTFF